MAVTYAVQPLSVNELLNQSLSLRGEGWRLCQILSICQGKGYELLYTFAKEHEMLNFQVNIEENTVVPSITPVFACAFLYENEIAELFGVNIEGIQVSYERKLYKLDVETPFKKTGK